MRFHRAIVGVIALTASGRELPALDDAQEFPDSLRPLQLLQEPHQLRTLCWAQQA